MKLRFEIPREPVGKARPRYTRNGKPYTPSKTSNYESVVKACFIRAYGKRVAIDGPVKISIDARCPIPKSWPKWKKQDAETGKLLPTVKPDVDNIAKIILDALNGIAFEDDKNVTSLQIDKCYSNEPGVTVTIETEDSNGT